MPFTGYEPFEIIGKNINDTKHPDVPQSIYNLLEEQIQANQNTQILFKDSTKKGQDFWDVSNFEVKLNTHNEVQSVVNSREPVTQHAIEEMSVLYKKLVQIEKTH